VEFLRKHGDSGAQAVQEAKDITDPLTDLPMLTKFLCSEMHVKLHGQWCQVRFVHFFGSITGPVRIPLQTMNERGMSVLYESFQGSESFWMVGGLPICTIV